MATKTIGIIFDMDDTLYWERDFVRSGYRAVCSYLEHQHKLSTTTPAADWLWNRFTSGVAGSAFDALSDKFNLALTESEIRQLVHQYRTHKADIALLPGMAAILDDLRSQPHIALGLITDGPAEMQRAKFAALHLSQWFTADAALFTDELPDKPAKPSPVTFERLARQYKLDGRQMMYIADNLSKDFIAPNQLGFTSICLRYGQQVHAHKPAPPHGQPTHTVTSVDELQAALHDFLQGQ